MSQQDNDSLAAAAAGATEEKKNSLLDLLRQTETLEQEETAGLDKFTGLRITSATDFLPLKPSTYKAVREKLQLYKDLPKPPTLGSLGFLVKKGSGDIKEIFEDSWTNNCLTYAAACDVYVHLTQLLETEAIPEDHEIFKAARRLILVASNAPARNLQTYKYIARKQVLKSTPKPGNSRDQVLSESEAKEINTELDTLNKLQRKAG